MSKILETDRIILREWQDKDRAPFARMNADPVIMEYLPRSLTEADSNKLVDRFIKHYDKNGYGIYVLERKEDGAFMGATGLQDVPFKAAFTPAIEIAWRLDYDFWGKGYASEAAAGVLKHGLEDHGMDEIVAFTVFDNKRSIGVMEKIGMKKVKGGEFQYPTLPKDHPLGSFVLYHVKA
ncbi:MAG: GNAT family N-acetyltransferase [Alphaproteobacteria bacterium]|nr:GNAT family N-acetyltransferase [Alphaproteobacteria bacterium]